VKYLLDSNIVIKLSRGTGNEALQARVAACDEDDMVTSAIVLAEVAHGSQNQKPPPVDDLHAFLDEVPVLPFDDLASFAYAGLPFKRSSYDRLIAAHALSLNLIVVTENTRDFSGIPGLRVENWSDPA
jgi:tRNA(fMet)-specific endonuclease VapC